MGRINVGHHVVGVVGMALLRTWQSDQVSAGEFLEKIAGIVAAPAQLPPEHVLDAACGTGRSARYLLAGVHTVVGVDSSDTMLAKAR